MVSYTFVRWIGGKGWLWKILKPYLIEDNHDLYLEPFVGGGAIASHYIKWCRKHNVKKQFILSDTNAGLINAYTQIRDNIDSLIDYLNELDSVESTKQLYYERRKTYNEIPKDSIESAGLFIWLMANGWRGLYRVNKRGEYNAPFGTAAEHCYSLDTLKFLHGLFKDVKFRCCSFEDIEENGLIYLDPPYQNTYQEYTINPPTNDKIIKFISDHRDQSSIYISNNEHFIPPIDSELVISTSISERATSIVNRKREERVWAIKNKM